MTARDCLTTAKGIFMTFNRSYPIYFGFLTLLFITACQHRDPVQSLSNKPTSASTSGSDGRKSISKTPWLFEAKKADEISVMTFNVENLFDTEQDADREDYTYLPLSLKQTKAHRDHCRQMTVPRYKEECMTLDWNDEFLEGKMKNLAEIILDLDGGVGPDVLMLEEVENINVLTQFNRKFLQKANYQTAVLLEGFDERGIDTALLSRFPIKGKAIIHKIPFDLKKIGESDMKKANTRGVLEVTLVTPQKKNMTVFVAHLPSQGNPTGMRQQATEFILSLMKKTPHFTVAGGDFNVTKVEEEENGYFKKFTENGFHVSHFFGCPACEGTHNYRKSWSFLDVLIFPKDFARFGFTIQPEHIDVVRYNPNSLYRDKYPKYFSSKEMTGASDHFPMYMRLIEKPAPTK